jgi:dynein intermediate chain 2
MEIVYVYSKKRADFGRQCNFGDRSAEMHINIMPDPSAKSNFIPKNPVDMGIQATKTYSEHEVNTGRYEVEVRGMNHTEGGWPKDIHINDSEHTGRFRKKVEKEENYTNTVLGLSKTMEHYIKQNNALDIYESYFDEIELKETEDIPEAKTINVFRDPCIDKRAVNRISWYADGIEKIAASYCNLKFENDKAKFETDSYIWDTGKRIKIYLRKIN